MNVKKDRNYYKALKIIQQNPTYKNQKEYTLKFFQKAALRQREILLSPETYGQVQFFFVVSLKVTNVFFTFYYKASNLPQRVFVLAKSSAGYGGRLLINKEKNERVERGRVKTSMFQIFNRLNMFRGFIYEMLVYNYMCFPYFRCMVIMKLYRNIDYITQRLALAQMPSEGIFELIRAHKKLPNAWSDYKFFYQYCFPHGGCRPKGERSINKKARKKQQKMLLGNKHFDVGLTSDQARYFDSLNDVEFNYYVDIMKSLNININ